MTIPRALKAELTQSELQELYALWREVDDLFETCLKQRASLEATLARCLPRALELIGGSGIALRTLDEKLEERTWRGGALGEAEANQALARLPRGGVEAGARQLDIAQLLEVDGAVLGRLLVRFEPPPDAARVRQLTRLVEVIAEELDTILVSLQTAREKHRLILEFNRHLSERIFEQGLDRAVLALSQQVELPGLWILYRDVLRPDVFHYRGYAKGHLAHASYVRPHAELEGVLRAGETAPLEAASALLRGSPTMGPMQELPITGGTRESPLGKLLVEGNAQGFSAFAIDVVGVLAANLAQRLTDHNRERMHLSQFFSPATVDDLLMESRYEARLLAPVDQEVGILYADINGFTRLCEQVLVSPSKIGAFVDRWSDGAVDILWKHGGVFDKMVGDCVIGLFGPPFFQTDRRERAEALTRAALELQVFTADLIEAPELTGPEGLGVAIGINVTRAYCGLVGPNRAYTAFSTGMNQTARLQSLGGFREILAMISVGEALEGTADAELAALELGPVLETAVKNVAEPLRYHRLRYEPGTQGTRRPAVHPGSDP